MITGAEADDVRLVELPAWRAWVTAKPLATAPIHRWFVFPHSFSGDLVSALSEEWELGSEDLLADPFVGAGTALVAGQQCGVKTIGFDLSPLAVFASKVKSSPADTEVVAAAWRRLRRQVRPRRTLPRSVSYDKLLDDAFDAATLATLHGAKTAILEDSLPTREAEFLLLALLRVLPRFSGLIQKGGWLTRVRAPQPTDQLRGELDSQVTLMLQDAIAFDRDRPLAHVVRSDARKLPIGPGTVSAVVTSPPYANRHDYTRVFGIELLFGFLDWHGTRNVRYQSIQSHPEAHPVRDAVDYEEPYSLAASIANIRRLIEDPRAKDRIPQMLSGYFTDLFLCLREIGRVLVPGGHAAVVIGNVQYCGVPLEVDSYVSDFGASVGLRPLEIRVARYRGNSAQQMKEFGRRPARESVVIFRRPS